MQRGSRGCSTRGGTPRFELGVAREAGQSAASCDFGAIEAWHKARRVSELDPKAGALYPRDENLLAELEAYRCIHPKSALASAACEQRWRGAAEAWSRWRGEASTGNKITHEDGGEATGAFAVQSSGSSKLVERRVVSSQGGAARPLPPGAPSPRASPPSRSAACAGCSHTNEWGSHTNEWGLDSLSQMTGSPLKFEKYGLGNGPRR